MMRGQPALEHLRPSILISSVRANPTGLVAATEGEIPVRSLLLGAAVVCQWVAAILAALAYFMRN